MTSRAVKPSDSSLTSSVVQEVAKRVVGQEAMLERLLIGLLTGGHILLEGVPGLAKTLAVSSLAETIRVLFQRIQFTPDLLPADIIGTMVQAQLYFGGQAGREVSFDLGPDGDRNLSIEFVPVEF